MLKRAFLNVTRKRSKSTILMIILFIVANLVVASIAINKSTKESMDFARESLGSNVSLTYDFLKIKAEMMESVESGEIEYGEQPIFNVQMEPIYLSEVEEISESKYVVDYRYGFQISANAVDFDAIESNNEKIRNFKNSELETGDVTLSAVNAYALLDEVQNGRIKLVEGESFDETNKNEVIISQSLATNNELVIDDTITLESMEEVSQEYSIIGIYEYLEDSSSPYDIQIADNVIFTNITSGVPLITATDYNDGDYAVINITYYLDDPLNIDEFTLDAKAKVTDFEERNLMLDVNNEAYEQMIGPINGVGEYSQSILIVILITTVAILSLMIINSIKSRNYEIGVLLSLGERAYKIVGQLFIELIIISTVAFGLSFLTSGYISQHLGDNLLENQLEISEEQSKDDYGRGTGFIKKITKSKETIGTIETIDVSVSINDYLKLFGLGYLIIFLSMIIPATQILRYDPKKILTKTEG